MIPSADERILELAKVLLRTTEGARMYASIVERFTDLLLKHPTLVISNRLEIERVMDDARVDAATFRDLATTVQTALEASGHPPAPVYRKTVTFSIDLPGPDVKSAMHIKPSDSGPDQARDVIVQFIQVIDASTGASRDSWPVFLGDAKLRTFDSEEEALAFARQMGYDNNRPAWLQDRGGYPLKRIV